MRHKRDSIKISYVAVCLHRQHDGFLVYILMPPFSIAFQHLEKCFQLSSIFIAAFQKIKSQLQPYSSFLVFDC